MMVAAMAVIQLCSCKGDWRWLSVLLLGRRLQSLLRSLLQL